MCSFAVGVGERGVRMGRGRSVSVGGDCRGEVGGARGGVGGAAGLGVSLGGTCCGGIGGTGGRGVSLGGACSGIVCSGVGR